MIQWILLRGLMREMRHWGDFPQRFSASFPQAQVSMLDLPGNGNLYQQASPTSVSAMTEACREQLRQRAIKPPYSLLALSLGAMVACEWSNRYPDEIDKAALINTSLRPFSPFYHRLQPRNYFNLLRLLSGTADARTREKLILQTTSNLAASESLIDAWTEYLQQYPVSNLNVLRQLRAATRYKAPHTAPKAKLLILSSAADRLVSARCSAKVAQQWQSPLHIHPWAGHDLTLDDPQWVIDHIMQWLEQPELTPLL